MYTEAFCILISFILAIQQRQAYEVVLPGFNGATDETDHLVRWGFAKNMQQLTSIFPDSEIYSLPVEVVQVGFIPDFIL